jgi:hypothetical protein
MPSMMLAAAAVALAMLDAGPGNAQTNPWVQYTEPAEHAYRIDVPRSWQVSGGIQRRSPMQPHSVLTLRSPGGVTEMVIGNVDAFTYSMTTPIGIQLGFHEGTITSPGTDNLRVLDYRTGQQFAARSGATLFAQRCQSLQLVRTRAKPGVQPRPQANGLTQGSTIGDAFFTCKKDGHTLNGYVFAETDYTTQPGVPGGIWNADNTYAFLTPEGNGNAAGIVMAHIIKSVRIDQQWLATQLQVSASLANHALAQANAQMDASAKDMQGIFSGTQQDAQNNQEEMTRLISGFDEYQTAAGERKTVPYATATNWWSNNKGHTIGTQSPNSPGVDWQDMTRVAPGRP